MANERYLLAYIEQFPAEFTTAADLRDFANRISNGDLKTPGPAKFLADLSESSQYWQQYFATVKEHGPIGRALALPTAHKIGDIFESAWLSPYQARARTVGEHIASRRGGIFVSAIGDPEFAFFGTLGGRYEWSPRFPAGQVRSQRGGQTWLTLAKPSAALLDYWGASESDDPEWGLSTVEAVRWSDGRRLIIGRSRNGFCNRWLTVLRAGETAMSLLGEHELGEIAAEKAARIAAFGGEG